MKIFLRWCLWGILLLSIAGYSIYTMSQPLQAELITVQPQTIVKTFSEEGVVVPKVEREIYTSMGGKVTVVNMDVGKEVSKGDLLVRLDTVEIGHQLEQLRGQLASLKGQEQQSFRLPYASQVAQQELVIQQAKANMDAAQKEADRLNVLRQAGAVSQETFDLAEAAVQQAQILLFQQEQALKLIMEQSDPPTGTREQFSGLRQALAAQIALLEYQVAQGKIYAPIDGKIKTASVKVGQVITAGTPVAGIFMPGSYVIEVFLLSQDMVQVKPGTKVQATQESNTGDMEYEGTVTLVAPTASEKLSALGLVERRVKATIDLEGDLDALRPGYTLDVKFTTDRQENKLVVPKTAVFPHEPGEAVWVEREGSAVIQPIAKGLQTGTDVVIEAGLQPGDKVIINPKLEGLKEGKKIAG